MTKPENVVRDLAEAARKVVREPPPRSKVIRELGQALSAYDAALDIVVCAKAKPLPDCVCGHSESVHLHGGSDGTGCSGFEPCDCMGYEEDLRGKSGEPR